jgi:hypothetical protein
MNRFAVALVTAVALALAPVLTPVVQAKQPQGVSGIQLPITGTVQRPGALPGTFEGTFTLSKFVNANGKVMAVGTITGIAKDSTGAVLASGLQLVELPFSTSGATPVTAAAAAPGIVPQAVCPILNLVLGPLHLDLLGLVVDLNQVVLNITAVSGAGNLLGNLLCAVAGLLDQPGPLANLLNQIIGILQGILAGL